jgi:nucleoside-diphosphate-sugar epimerase
MANVFITGGAGYIGSVLSDHLLRAGHSVTVLDRLMYGGHGLLSLCQNPRFKFVQGDARDRDAIKPLMRDADVLIPLAAVVGAPACDNDPWLARSVNLEAIQLLDQVRSPNQLVIYPTTNSGYGTQTGDMYCTEETPLAPISLYGQTKVQAELELLERPRVITLRLATVFGISPRMRLDLLVNHFVYAAVTDGYLVIFEKDFKRNYIHVRDVADCFLHCIDHAEEMVGRPYNAGLDSANISKDELAQKIKEYVPNFYIHHASIGSDPDKRNYIVSNERLRGAGFSARRSLDAGIQELITGYRLLDRGTLRNA